MDKIIEKNHAFYDLIQITFADVLFELIFFRNKSGIRPYLPIITGLDG